METALVQEIRTANSIRADFCYFLASLYLYELTEEQVEAFAHLKYTNDGSKIAQGYAQIVEYLRHRNSGTRQELAVDYAHTFLCAGTYEKVFAPPYESVFTSRAHILMQNARDGALAYYRSEGLDLPADNTTPEDHLGFELQFMAELVDRSTAALDADDEARFAELVDKQHSFFTFHQKNWLPVFCDAIDEYCQTDFYHGVANLTRGYLHVEEIILDDLAEMLGLDADEKEIRSPWMDSNDDSDKFATLFA